MPARDDDFTALAKRLGVASSYLDQGDSRVEISRDTQAALMDALGFAASTPAQLREAHRRLDSQRGVLPPWLVLDAGVSRSLEIAQAVKPTRWRISGDNGFQAGQSLQGRIEIPALEPGYYHLELDGQRARTLLIAAPRKCWTPPAFASGDARGWGLTAQVYGLRSQRNFGIGDFTDVANLAKAAERHGASFLG
ncbi:MAG: malto-oligosyltrehalose synthase, partial [Hyphomicrobiales bacterium]|nr:malto-oligosyltrehalose synthase [Hyphomicrobiales bacterium]